MANPSWVTSENVKFNGTMNNAVVLKTAANIRSLILWDSLSGDDKTILTKFIDDNGGALPLSGPTAGVQYVDFGKTKKAADATGLNNTASATASKATIDLGTSKAGSDPSGLSASLGTKGSQVVNYNTTLVSGTTTNLVPTSGHQSATFTAAKTGSSATGLAADTTGYQIVNVGGAKTGASATGLTNDIPATNGYQFINVGGAKTGADATGLTNDATAYTASISVDGTPIAISVVGSAAQTFTTLLAEINTDLGASATASISGGDIKITSATTGVTSIVSITDTDLFSTLTGYVALVTKVDGVNTVVTTYTASISIDAGAHVRAVSIAGGAAQTITTLIAEINADSGAFYTAALVGGNIKITSNQPGATSDIVITDTDIFSSLTGYVAILTGIAGTSTTYTTTITVDGVAKPISIVGNAAQTFTTLVNEINTDLGASAVAAVTSGGITVTSATTTPTSTVLMITGTLFPALTNFSAITAAVAGTGSTTALTATIVVDGVTKNISVLPTVITTFGDVINEINTDLAGAATASISGGDIKVTSATYGVHSTVAITDITLFSTLPSFAYVLPTQPGGSTAHNYTATIVVDNIIRPISFTGALGDTIQHVIDEINTDLNSAASSGHQDVLFSNFKVGTYATGLVGATTYTATIVVDGVSKSISILGSNAQTFTTLLSEINTDLAAAGTVSIVGGNLRVVSATTGTSSTITITDITLFAALAGYQSIAPAIAGLAAITYGTATLTSGDIVITSATTGLSSSVKIYDVGALFSSLTGYVGITYTLSTAPKLYTATITVDGVAKAISLQGSAAQTFTTLLNEINTDLGASATASLALVAAAGYQSVTFATAKVGGTATGLANDTTAYTATITIDGTPNAVSVVGSAAQTYTNLITQINADLSGATAAVTDGGITITSTATGLVSKISIVDSGTNHLFASLTGFSVIKTAIPGTDSNILITSATTGVASKVRIVDGNLFESLDMIGITTPVDGITDIVTAATLQKDVKGLPVFDHFDVLYVGLKPHLPTTPAALPKTQAYTYWDGTVWKYLVDDTTVNP